MERGKGDAQAAAAYAEAYSKSPEFYAYQRWLEAMRKSFKDNSKMVLTNEAPLLNRNTDDAFSARYGVSHACLCGNI